MHNNLQKFFRCLKHSSQAFHTTSLLSTTLVRYAIPLNLRSFPSQQFCRFDKAPGRASLISRGFCTENTDKNKEELSDETSEIKDDNMSNRPTRVLNVAEKNDAAKRISALLSGGNVRTVRRSLNLFLLAVVLLTAFKSF